MFASCETYTEVDLPKEAPQITVNSIFNADSTLHVNLTKSRASGLRGEYEKIENAEVIILKNHLKIGQLSPIGKGSYRLAGKITTEAGALYSLKVNASGFKTAEAEELMPEKPLIRSYTAPPYTPITPVDFSPKDFKISLTFDDPPKENFYLLKAFLQSPGSKTDISLGIKNNLAEFRTSGNYTISMFTDKLFNGKSQLLELEIGTLYIPEGPHSIVIELANTSKAYYDYEYSVKKQLANNPLFGQEYIPVTNNIKNGLGIFATYNSSSFSFEVRR